MSISPGRTLSFRLLTRAFEAVTEAAVTFVVLAFLTADGCCFVSTTSVALLRFFEAAELTFSVVLAAITSFAASLGSSELSLLEIDLLTFAAK